MRKYVLMALWLGVTNLVPAQNQNRYEESIPYKEWNNEMVISVKIGKNNYPFILQPNGKTTVLTDRVDELGVSHQVLPALTIGTAMSAERVRVNIEDNEAWRSRNIAGIIGKDVLCKSVVSFNRRAKTIIFSAPFKPASVELRNRIILHNQLLFELPYAPDAFLPVEVDLTGSDFLYVTPADYHKVKHWLKNERLAQVKFVKTILHNQPVTEDHFADVSRLGGAVLDEGIVCIDYANNRLYFQPYADLHHDRAGVTSPHKTVAAEADAGVEAIDRVQFNEKIFNYRSGHKWNYLGDKPAIVSFWAEWCAPCKTMLPLIEKLAAKYAGKIDFYKIDVDEEQEVAKTYNMVSIPALMFVPGKGSKVQTKVGVRTEKEMEALIRKYFKNIRGK